MRASARLAQRFPSTIDVVFVASREAANRRAANRVRNLAHRLEIARRSDRKASFDHIHAQIHERLRDFQLLFEVHAAAGRLLAVAERGIENNNRAVLRCGRHGIVTVNRFSVWRIGRDASNRWP